MKSLILFLGVSLLTSTSFAYEDDRDFKSSKAKGQIRQLHKKLDEIDKALEEGDKFKNTRWFEGRCSDVEKQIEKIPEKDSSWDLSKEKAHYEDQKKKWASAASSFARAEMEGKEPDPAEEKVEPWLSAPKIETSAPDWCKAAPFDENDSWIGKRYYSDMSNKLEDRDVIRRQAEHPCRAPDFDKRLEWSRNWRQSIANLTGADAALISRVYALAMKERNDKELVEKSCKDYAEKKSRAGTRAESPREASLKKALAFGLGCQGSTLYLNSGNTYIEDLDWWVDRSAAPPSELVRAVLILRQIGFEYDEGMRKNDHDFGEKALNRLRNYAIVATDIERLDEKKFKEELSAMKLDEYKQVMAEVTFTKARHFGRIYAALYKEMAPGIQELAMTASKAGFTAWEKEYAENKEGVDLALDVEDKAESERTSDIKDCHDKAHLAFTKYYGKRGKGINDLEEKKAIVRNTSIGHTLYKASMICAAYEGQYGVAVTMWRNGLENVRDWRGPRVASYWSMMDRFGELSAKDSSFPLKADDLKLYLDTPNRTIQYAAYETTFNKTGFAQFELGEVKGVKKTKNGVDLTFKTVKWTETIWDCKETTRIDRITADGQIIYRKNCKAAGTKTASSTVKPYSVPAAWAAGIKSGSFVKAMVENAKGGRIGVPVEVFKNKDQKQLDASLGAEF